MPTLAGLQAHPGLYIGPALVSLTVEALITGILINQSLTFWERAERERAVVRALVSFVTVVAFFQTCLSFFTSWRTFVEHFGDWPNSVAFIWADKLRPSVVIAMTAPVQTFLIWRCWMLVNRNIYVLATLVLLLLATIVSGIVVTTETFHIQFGVLPVTDGPIPKLPVNATFVLSLSCSAVLDVLVTGIRRTVLTFLARSKQNVTSSRFRRILKRLNVLIWEAALPPCVCAVMAVIVYLISLDDNYWDLTFQALLGKLYVMSLFVTLNGRAGLRNRPIAGVSTLGQLSNLAWGSFAHIRVNMPTDVESASDAASTAQVDERSVADGVASLGGAGPPGPTTDAAEKAA